MFAPLRRCPTSIRWRLVSSAAQSSPISSPLIPRHAFKPSARSPPTSIRSLFTSPSIPRYAAVAAVDQDEPLEEASGPITKFAELDGAGLVNPILVRTLTNKMKIETMTEVQSLTLHEALQGKDVLAQAKTGTGKTIGFLLPVLQRMLQEDETLIKRSNRAPKYGQRAADVRAIVISPTRELAEQIAEEARKITQDTGIVIQCAVGGTQKSAHLRQMQREGCHILVGTPGRLKDVFSDQQTGVSAPKLSALVLDEADRLLDQGFWPEIQAIQDLLPSKTEKDRQTLMFSATLSKDVVKLVRSVMKPDLHYVRTVQDNEEPTHEHVKQSLVTVASLENLLPTILELCERSIQSPADPTRPFKAILYFNSTAEVTLASQLFMSIRRGASPATSPARHDNRPSHVLNAAASFTGTHLQSTRIYEIHSRLSQSQRTAAATHFRAAESGLLMSSDVTARGMDFPGVTHVIQVGLPSDRETYIHRLGRTARAGQEGEGWLIVPTPYLNEMRQRLGKLPLTRDTTLASATVDFGLRVPSSETGAMTPAASEFFTAVAEAGKRAVGAEEAQSTYLALLGTHQWVQDKGWLIGAMNRLSEVQWGMKEPPSVSRGLAVKMKILGLPGVRVGGGARREEEGRERAMGGRNARSFGDAERGPPRSYGDRAPRSGGSSYGDRPARTGGSSYGDRGDRPSRGGFGDRAKPSYGDRSERGGGDRKGGSGGGGFGGRGRTSDRSSGGSGRGGRDGGDRGRTKQRDDYGY
jgi:ATP-dependent RNA helicase MSS116